MLFTLALPLLLNFNISNALKTHEHGHSTINLVAEGNQLSIEFESPAVNLIGFEHKPETDDQQAAIDKGIARLLDFQSLFVLSENVRCEIIDKSANWILDAEHSNHAEFQASYQLSCDLSDLRSIELTLFNHFPGIEEIDAQILFADIQLVLELDARNRSIQLR